MTKWRVRRWEQIYGVAAAAGGAGMTRKDVAGALGLRKSEYLVQILRAMVAAGWLREVWDDDRPHPSFLYIAVAQDQAVA